MCKFVSISLQSSGKIKRVLILTFTPLLMCLKDLESEIEKEKLVMEKPEKSNDCPLCLEALEFDDKNFYPCTCGYQICRFCWHGIRTNENGLCPACRRIYPENPANFQPLTPEELQEVKLQKKMKDQQKKQKTAENRKQLANIRVIQKNLVFAVGLPLELSQDNQKKEKVLSMFRQFGQTHKEAITDRTSYAGSQGLSACVYITYQRPEDAVRSVKSLSNTKIEGRTIKVSLGTTKYCSNFLKNVHCPKAECLYLHELADEEASFTKEDIHLGKHLEYEQKLLEQTLNNVSNASHNKTHSQNNETNRTNHNQHVDNCSESSDDVPQNNSLCSSSEASELSPSSSQNFENRNSESEVNNELENTHQNIPSSNLDTRNNGSLKPDPTSPNPVFRTEESINNHSQNSTFQDTSSVPVTSTFSNQVQTKETRPSPQTNFFYNSLYDISLSNRLQSSSSSANESSFLRLMASQNSTSNRDSTSSFPNVLNTKQAHNTQYNNRDDDPDLEFDPCEESLNGLQQLILDEKAAERESAPKNCFNFMNRSSSSNRSSTVSVPMTSDGLGYRNAFSQPMKMREPPPGFTNNTIPNIMYKNSYEIGNTVMNKPHVVPHNQLNIRANYTPQRFVQPSVSLNNSSFTDYSPQLPREVPDSIMSSLMHQQHNQRFMNFPQQAQYPIEQRSSPSWAQTQWRPVETPFLNQSVPENRVSSDIALRMQQQMRPNENPMRQWHHMNGNVNNMPMYQEMSEQAKLNAIIKAQMSQRNAAMPIHRLQYTKKL